MSPADRGTYLGILSDNPYDPDSVSNPYGRYGSRNTGARSARGRSRMRDPQGDMSVIEGANSSTSINNPFSTYGSPDAMHLIYLDESGNSGGNLQDPQQPVFVLGALVVHESVWQPVELDLEASVIRHLPLSDPDVVEIHGGDLRHGTGPFKGVSVAARLDLRNDWLQIAQRHGGRSRAVDCRPPRRCSGRTQEGEPDQPVKTVNHEEAA